MFDVDRFLRNLSSDRYYDGQMVHVRTLPQREAVYGELARPLPESLRAALVKKGIERLYTHQVSAIEAIRDRQSVVIVTGTASGKTLCYNLPMLEILEENPRATALFIYPTKALAQDQLRGLAELRPPLAPPYKGGEFPIPPTPLNKGGVESSLLNKGGSESPLLDKERGRGEVFGTYDGDTTPDVRRSLRDDGNIILTNPDMLHQGILPNHARWGRFFSNLRMVVIDEVHSYRGVFGSNVANVMRRLNRIAAHYGSKPLFVCCSATIANPAEHASHITGRKMLLIDNDGSPRGPRKFVLWNPPLLAQVENERRSPNTEAKELMTRLVKDKIQTIAFVKTRLSAELILRYCQEALRNEGPRLANAVHAYRGGYLPEERREIERRLASGDLLAVASTNALELGIDIGGLDAAILVGFPGTIASMWQQAGRAGRGGDEAVIFLVGFNSPIDQYFMRHADYLFGRVVENAIVNADNPHISVGHIRSALYELPIREDESDLFGEYTLHILKEILPETGNVREQLGRFYWQGQGFPAADINLRVMQGIIYTIIDTAHNNRTVGTIDEFGAFHELHKHAVYFHEGAMYFVNELDVEKKIAYVEPRELDYFTQAMAEEGLRIDETEEERIWRSARVCLGDITVETMVYMFKKVRFETRESIGFENLDLPTRQLPTQSFWIIPPPEARKAVRMHGRVFEDGLIGIANVLREVIPTFAMCDTSDIGATIDAGNLGVSALFVYDRYEHGIGFSEKAFGMIEEIMQRALEVVADCPCPQGCPSCVGSATPARGQGPLEATTRGRIPDKETALIILHELLQLEPYEPKYPIRGGFEPEPPPVEAAPPPEPPPVKRLPPNMEKKIRKRVQKFKKE